MIWTRALAGIVATSLVSAAVAQPKPGRVDLTKIEDLPEIVRLAVKNNPNLRYAGARVIEFRMGTERKRHTELVMRDASRVRIEFPEGSPFAGQIIVESKGERRHFFPDRNEIHVMPARREEAFGRLFQMMGKRRGGEIKLAVSEGEEIAGQRTSRVDVNDPAGNTMQRMWIHPTTGMILKREMFDRVGTRVGFFEFTTVDFTPKFGRDEFSIKRKGAKTITPYDRMRSEAQKHGFAPLSLPKSSGFTLEHARGFSPPDGKVVFVQTYSGGKSRVTLFAVKTDLDQDRLARMARGLSTYRWQRDGTTLVLVGDLSTDELRRLAAKVK